jgi:hypothetical protein
MTIPVKRETWAKPRLAIETRQSSDLSPEEQASAKAALRFLATRHGGAASLAKAMRSTLGAVAHALSARGTVSAGLALRAARVAAVPVEEILCGAWPKPGACPTCGRVAGTVKLLSRNAFCLQSATNVSEPKPETERHTEQTKPASKSAVAVLMLLSIALVVGQLTLLSGAFWRTLPGALRDAAVLVAVFGILDKYLSGGLNRRITLEMLVVGLLLFAAGNAVEERVLPRKLMQQLHIPGTVP